MEKLPTIREELSPQEVVGGATTQAKLLMDIVQKTGCFQEISGKKYLQVEAWETIGAFNRTNAVTESITSITRDSEVIGYQAKVQLWKDGVVIGGAIMPCYFTENCCKGKEGDAKHKACMSAAQTFATSKSYRMNFSYVAILAGYQPLPADEITEDMKQEAVDKTKHWCEEHNTQFFKKGKMKAYAHPIGDSGEWCHEHTEDKPQSKQPKSKPVEVPVAKEVPEHELEPVQPTIPTNIQELLTWASSHGREFNRSWVLKNFSVTEEELKTTKGIEQAYHEILVQMPDWEV